MKNTYILLISIIINILVIKTSYSQCSIVVTLPTQDTTICLGDSLYFKADGTCSYLMNNNFNNGVIGSGWSSTAANPVYNNPCGTGPSGFHLWVGTTASPTRTLVTNSYDFSIGGCVVNWWMRYGRIQGSGPCEDPDAANEGVHLQYSTNNGTSWTDFPGPNINPSGVNSITGPFVTPMVTTNSGSGGYWQPLSSANSQGSSPLYYWHFYENMVPAAAATTSTRIRWAQLANSSAGWDAWGIDEVQISCPNNQNVFWSYGATGLQPTAAVFPTTSGPYVVIIMDSIGNIAMDTINVIVIPNPQPNLGPDTAICAIPGNQTIFDAGPGYDTYLWSTGVTTQTITTSTSGTYSVTVTSGNCSGSDVVDLTLFLAPTADAGLDDEICIGDSTLLSALQVPNCTYLWSTGDSTSDITVAPNTDSLYYLKTYSSLTCFSLDSVMVTVNPLPDVFAGNDTMLCYNDTIKLKAHNANTYVWNDGRTYSSINVSPLVTTVYSVTGTDNNGCVNFDDVSVAVNALPILSITSDKEEYCYGDTIYLDANGADTYHWSNGNSGANIMIDATGSMIVSVVGTDINECIDDEEILLNVEDCVKFFIASAFTPNGDGLNDIFIPTGQLDGIVAYSFIMYDRLGNVIFETTDYNQGWNGYIDGQLYQGVYTYLVSFTTIAGRTYSKGGTVTLIP